MASFQKINSQAKRLYAVDEKYISGSRNKFGSGRICRERWPWRETSIVPRMISHMQSLTNESHNKKIDVTAMIICKHYPLFIYFVTPIYFS